MSEADLAEIKKCLKSIDERLARLEEIMDENKKVADDMHQHTWILERMSVILSSPRLALSSMTGVIGNG